MAELRPYNPSWRDSIASMLMGDSRASPERARFVEGLVGSRGLGSTGANLADMTPIGMGFAANEYARAQTPVEAVFAAVGLLPAAKPPVVAARAAASRAAANAFESYGKREAREFASNSARMYNPPVKEARPFSLDYPNGGGANAAGRLTETIDGDPISARHVVGRTEVGGRDVALPSEALDEIAAALTGAGIYSLPQSGLGRGTVGKFAVRAGEDGPIRTLNVLRTLSKDQYEKVAAHEVGHAIDHFAAEIPTEKIMSPLRAVYNDLNNPSSYGKIFGPENNGYVKGDAGRELIAEAIRAYMIDPNYLKTAAPSVAGRIREWVNTNPRLKDVIQFNGVAAPIAGLAALPIPDEYK